MTPTRYKNFLNDILNKINQTCIFGRDNKWLILNISEQILVNLVLNFVLYSKFCRSLIS